MTVNILSYERRMVVGERRTLAAITFGKKITITTNRKLLLGIIFLKIIIFLGCTININTQHPRFMILIDDLDYWSTARVTCGCGGNDLTLLGKWIGQIAVRIT